MSNLPKPIEQTWMMFFRDRYEKDGRWWAWPETARRTRRECIDDAVEAGVYRDLRTRSDYTRLRRRGVVRCATATIYAALPQPDEGGEDDGE